MSFFRRAPEPLLPADFGWHLDVWGRHEYDSTQFESAPFTSLHVVSRVQLVASQQPQREPELGREIIAAAYAKGGWALYGGSRVLHAFLPLQYGTPAAAELQPAHLGFLRSEAPNLRAHLMPLDRPRYRELFPGEI